MQDGYIEEDGTMEVITLNVVSPDEIYVFPVRAVELEEKMVEELAVLEGAGREVKQPQLDHLYAARHHDGWNRAIVTTVEPGAEVTVFCIDYGEFYLIISYQFYSRLFSDKQEVALYRPLSTAGRASVLGSTSCPPLSP